MRHFMGFLLLVASGMLAGCGGEGGIDGTLHATGTVTYQGKSVEGAMVIFAPEGEGRAASGTTDAAGRFAMTTLTAGDGVLPGKYQVSISKTKVAGEMTEEESQAYFQEHGESPTTTSQELLPAKYKTADTSGLTVEVTAGGKNDFTFDLMD
jgi:hypothetical protein